MTLQNHGIIKTSPGHAEFAPIPIPRLRDGYILVKTVAVALNPADWQNLDEKFKPGTKPLLSGHDAAGIVVAVGKGVRRKFNVGDRVAGTVYGGNVLESEDGTFAEYIVLKGDVTLLIPTNVSFEEAATLPCGLGTVILGFYKYLELPFPNSSSEMKFGEETILIYGGSTATGTIAIQFAKLSGLKVITTASPRNFDLLRELGADHVLDYSDPDCGNKIRSLTNNSLHRVFDTIAISQSAKICAEAMSSSGGGIYVNLMGVDQSRKDVKNIFALVYTMRGEAFEYEGEVWKAQIEDFELMRKFVPLCEDLLRNGLMKPHPISLREGGLKGTIEGMKELKDGKVSGVKLVYRVDEVS